MGSKLSIYIPNEQEAYLRFLQELWDYKALSGVIQQVIQEHANTSGYEFVPATFRKKGVENAH